MIHKSEFENLKEALEYVKKYSKIKGLKINKIKDKYLVMVVV